MDVLRKDAVLQSASALPVGGRSGFCAARNGTPWEQLSAADTVSQSRRRRTRNGPSCRTKAGRESFPDSQLSGIGPSQDGFL